MLSVICALRDADSINNNRLASLDWFLPVAMDPSRRLAQVPALFDKVRQTFMYSLSILHLWPYPRYRCMSTTPTVSI